MECSIHPTGFGFHWLLIRRRNKPQGAEETIWTFIFYFSNISNIFSLSENTNASIWIQTIYMSNFQHFTCIYKLYKMRTQYEQPITPIIQINPSINRDGTLQNHHMNHKILQKSLCHQWHYSTCQASHKTSFQSSWSLFRHCQMLTNHEAYQIYSHPVMMSNLIAFHNYFLPHFVLYSSHPKCITLTLS